MSDAAKDSFKIGFLTRCAEEGLTGETLAARLEKLAAFNEKTANSPWDDIYTAGTVLAGIPLAASLLGGGAVGHGLARLNAPKLDEDTLKHQELIDTYKVMADRARSKRKLREYRMAR